jgi:hypothetical protein
MANYILKYTGYIDERERPVDFAKSYSDFVPITANNGDELDLEVSKFLINIGRLNGLIVRKDTTKSGTHIFIPMKYFKLVDVSILPVVQPMSNGKPVELTQ